MVQLFVRGPGGRPGRRGEVSAQPDCRPMVLSGDDPAHQFSGGGGHRRRGPGGGTAAHVQKCSSVFEDRTLRWFYHLFHFFTGDGGAAGAGEMGRRGRVHPGQRGSVPGGGAAGAGPGVEDPLRMETRI